MPQEQTTHKQHIEWLRRSSTRRRPLLEDRIARAWQTAHRAAQLLQDRYGVNRVRVFGSLLHPDQFHAKSDVDLAVEGLAVQDYWDAVADILFLDDEITIDLVDPSTCLPPVWATVEREGVEL
jgi:predicted nucleotidyltransferase